MALAINNSLFNKVTKLNQTKYDNYFFTKYSKYKHVLILYNT